MIALTDALALANKECQPSRNTVFQVVQFTTLTAKTLHELRALTEWRRQDKSHPDVARFAAFPEPMARLTARENSPLDGFL